SWGYEKISQRRLRRITPTKVSVPVICVGNISLGGTGKTPLSISLAEHFLKKEKKVGFLTRGYGGRFKGPIRVNTNHHSAQDVGDEPLLLARVAPTWVAQDRVAGARQMIKKGINLIIMDDGHQNAFLHKDISFVVIDGQQGFGNKRVFPLGPLRESVADGLSRSDAIIIMGGASEELKEDLKGQNIPTFDAEVSLKKSELFSGKGVAFCGIGHPEKFFTSLENAGLDLVHKKSFPDHYPYKTFDILSLKKKAGEYKAPLLTTEKDWVRLCNKDKKDVIPLPIAIKWKKWKDVDTLLSKKIFNA
ncbi:tetraacyldisaccharide 4'-kinase, partial [Alphaproteobacteria bacterium]|nr:tetraacyldisaccharide 4'-kinase [Alphaproteobacteria bacterium]